MVSSCQLSFIYKQWRNDVETAQKIMDTGGAV